MTPAPSVRRASADNHLRATFADPPMPMNAPNAAACLTLLARAELQDHLLAATHDLDRLQGLLADACATLMEGFLGVTQELKGLCATPSAQDEDLGRVLEHLATAARALQFQDLSAQLIAHTSQRLRHCAGQLAQGAFVDDDDGEAAVEEAPPRPNPVTQQQLDGGSVELF